MRVLVVSFQSGPGRHGHALRAVERVAQHQRQEVHQRHVAALREQHRDAYVPVPPVGQRACAPRAQG